MTLPLAARDEDEVVVLRGEQLSEGGGVVFGPEVEGVDALERGVERLVRAGVRGRQPADRGPAVPQALAQGIRGLSVDRALIQCGLTCLRSFGQQGMVFMDVNI